MVMFLGLLFVATQEYPAQCRLRQSRCLHCPFSPKSEIMSIDENMLSLIQARSTGSQMYKRVGFALLIIFIISYGYIYATNVQFTVLSNEDRNTMSWVAQNTPPERQFAIITRL